jgi:hypothetical protein
LMDPVRAPVAAPTDPSGNSPSVADSQAATPSPAR